MARATVLVVDTQEARRKEVVKGLAASQYEVIVAATAHEGEQFIQALGPEIVISEGGLAGVSDRATLARLAARLGSKTKHVVFWGEEEEPEELPGNLRLLPLRGLSPSVLIRRLRTAMVSFDLGLETDLGFEALIGSIEKTSLFDFLPLAKTGVLSGRLLLGGGEIEIRDGDVVAARVGRADGLKAFCRLARRAQGTFKFILGGSEVEQTLARDQLTLMAEAIEDQHRVGEGQAELGDLAARLRVVIGPTFFATAFTPTQQKILECAQGGVSILDTVDAVPALDGEVLAALAGLLKLGFVGLLPPEIKVRIVTDSTADLTHDAAAGLQVHVVPVSVFFGDKIFKDGVDLAPREFYEMLLEEKESHPRTRPPTKGELQTAYGAARGHGDLVAIHVSEAMSETVVNAREAARGLVVELSSAQVTPVPEIYVVDSRHVSAGLGMVVTFAARMAQRGVPAREIARQVEAICSRTSLIFSLDTLEYLARGGRIGKAGALFGNLLGIKPILEMREGHVVALDKARGSRDIEAKMVEHLRTRVAPDRPVFLSIGHALAPTRVDRLRALAVKEFKVIEILESEIGPGVGTNVGPGTVGCAIFQPTEQELTLFGPPVSE